MTKPNRRSIDALAAAQLINQTSPYPQTQGTQLADTFRILGDDTRLQVLYYLKYQPEINVRTFCELLGQSQPAVSHHLLMLKDAGFIECRREGKNNFYRLVPKKANEFLGALDSWNHHIPPSGEISA